MIKNNTILNDIEPHNPIYTGEDIDVFLENRNINIALLEKISRSVKQATSTINKNWSKNAIGIMSYHNGVATLREECDVKYWDSYDNHNVCGIVHRKTGIKMFYSNVKTACDRSQEPQPLSEKGLIYEAYSKQLELFDVTDCKKQNSLPYYICLDKEGRLELIQAEVKNGSFTNITLRVFIFPDIYDSAKLNQTKPFDTEVTVIKRNDVE